MYSTRSTNIKKKLRATTNLDLHSLVSFEVNLKKPTLKKVFSILNIYEETPILFDFLELILTHQKFFACLFPKWFKCFVLQAKYKCFFWFQLFWISIWYTLFGSLPVSLSVFLYICLSVLVSRTLNNC